MKRVSKLISEILNVIKRHPMLIVSSLTAGFLILLGLVKLIEVIVIKVIETIINIF